MPIGATIGGAVIAGGAAVGAGAMSAKAQKKAAASAADTSLQVANENNALFREIYGNNSAILDPFRVNGLASSNALTELLLGPQATKSIAPSPVLAGGGGSGGGTSNALSPLQSDWGRISGYLTDSVKNNFDPAAASFIQANLDKIPTSYKGPTWDQIQGYRTDNIPNNYENALNALGSAIASAPRPATTPTPAPSTGGTGAGTGGTGGTTGTPSNALDAFAKFRQGTNYTWRLNEGLNALQSGFAARGALDSGAANRAAITFGQNFASNELARYMDLLASQQAMGLSAAGAVAGQATQYAGNVASQNTSAANAAASAALAGGAANAGMWGTIGNTAGQLGGALFQYGMGQMPGAAVRPATAPMTSGGYNVTPNYPIPWGFG